MFYLGFNKRNFMLRCNVCPFCMYDLHDPYDRDMAVQSSVMRCPSSEVSSRPPGLISHAVDADTAARATHPTLPGTTDGSCEEEECIV